MVVIGAQGVGKSTLCRTLSGINPKVTLSGRETDSIEPKKVNWRGNDNFPVVLIDTPSLTTEMKMMATLYDKLTEEGHIHVFLAIIDGKNPRIGKDLLIVMKKLTDKFGKELVSTNLVVSCNSKPTFDYWKEELKDSWGEADPGGQPKGAIAPHISYYSPRFPTPSSYSSLRLLSNPLYFKFSR